MNIICEHCQSTLSSKYVLKNHLSTNKACLAIRNAEPEKTFKCKACTYVTTNNQKIMIHQETCKMYKVLSVKEDYQQELNKKDSIIVTLQESLKEKDYIINEYLQLKVRHEELKIRYDELSKQHEKTIEKLELKISQCDSFIQTLAREGSNKYEENNKSSEDTIDEKSNNDIQEYKFGNNFIVPIRSDGMINATSLCKAGGKRIEHYKENLQTKAYLEELSSVTGIPVIELFNPIIGGKYPGTWVHRKVGYHLAQWISPKFAVKVSSILDELFITGNVELYNEKTSDEIDTEYEQQIITLKTKLDTNEEQYQKLLIKHNSSLKTHRYIKFKKTDPCFYIIDSGIECECLRYKFGITGVDQDNNIDDRLRCHRTLWPQLKVRYLLFIKDVQMIEKNFKMMYEKEINPNGHEIIEGVSFDDMISRIEKLFDILCIKEYHVMTADKLKEYNDYVDTTVKII
jgi:hypothetical protein